MSPRRSNANKQTPKAFLNSHLNRKGNTMDTLSNAARVYGELLDQKKAIEAQLKELEPHLKEQFADKGTVISGGYAYNAKTQAGRRTLDKTSLNQALSKHGLDMEAFYTVGAPYVRMSVTKVAEGS